MVTKLKDLVITKVALVDAGSCSEAHIKLFKRKEGGNKMTFEEIMKSLSAEDQAVVQAEIDKSAGTLPEGALSAEDAEKLEATKKAALDEVESLKKAKNAEGSSDEDILKNANLDPAVRAVLESAVAKSKATEVMLKKMQEEKETAEIVAKTKDLKAIPEVDTKVLELCKSIRHVDGAVDQVLEILKSADGLIQKGSALGELGTGGGAGSVDATDANEAWAAIEKAADQLVSKSTEISKAKAIELVLDRQPELYATYTKALRAQE